MAATPLYGIAWREGDGRTYVGQLELAGDALALRGATTEGDGTVRYVPYGSIAEVRIGRGDRELVNGWRHGGLSPVQQSYGHLAPKVQ